MYTIDDYQEQVHNVLDELEKLQDIVNYIETRWECIKIEVESARSSIEECE